MSDIIVVEKDKEEPVIEHLSSEEYFSLSNSLERHHAVFYKFWQIGRPTLTNQEQTCSVSFDEKGQFIDFKFNPELWKNSTTTEKEFFICHECMHLILEHGKRINVEKMSHEDNVAADIVVNHLLERSFGFDRKDISLEDKLCWTDTVFKDIFDKTKQYSYINRYGNEVTITSKSKIKIPPPDQSYEFYYNLIKQIQDKIGGPPGSSGPTTVDNHSGFSGKGLPKDIVDQICNGLSNEEKESLRDKIQDQINQPQNDTSGGGRGTDGGEHWLVISIEKIKKKKKWETVIKKWAATKTKIVNRNIEQWARLNRRFVLMSQEFFIPTELEYEADDKDKIDVWFFQDTSGSCTHLAKRFFKAALSLPTERFNISLFCFDTKVYEVDPIKKQLYGFGGTSFNIIESYIIKKIEKEDKKYPCAVFIITDGYGNNVHPKYPDKWYWFLSTNCKSCIPKECHTFMLKDFE